MPEETARDENDERRDRPDGVELPVCSNCMTPCNPFDRFCRECGAPLSPLTGFDPMGRIYSQGFVFRKAATRRVSKMTVVLLWLLLAPWPIVYVIFGAGSLLMRAVSGRPLVQAPLGGLLALALGALLPGLLLWRVTANYLRQRDRPGGGDEPGEADEETGE